MHEFGIAQSIVQAAEQETRQAGADRVMRLTVELGELSGVVAHYLRAAFPVVARDTLLEQAELEIRMIPGVAWCEHCQKEFELPTLLSTCPTCEGFATEVRAGLELVLASLDVE